MAPFDPYHIWLEIPPDEQPPTPHRLLGIAPDETDKEIIREAALQRNAFIRQFSLGEQGQIAERLLNKIAAARDNILAGKVQTAVETPLPVETPIEPVVEKTDPAAVTPVSPIPVVVREPATQEFPVSVVQTAQKPQIEAQKKNWERPAVIGVSAVGGIGVFVLLISLMFSGDAEPVASNSLGMTLNKIPAGTFMMGSPADETGRYESEHQHQVTITKPFYMQTTEVTQGQWTAVMGTEPWKGEQYVKEGPNYAATWVSWDDAVAYCEKLSIQEGKAYRLPTEAEWEYACRAGTETRWSFSNDEKDLGDYAWHKENARDIGEEYAHQVGLKKPNAFGLYDMHGNVWEWCHDYFEADYYERSPEQDPRGPQDSASDSSRVLRGGSWGVNTRNSRSANRFRDDADNRYITLFGFRLVRELD